MSKRFYIHCGVDINKQLFDTESDFNIHIEEVSDEELLIQLCNLLNELHEENMDLRAKHTQMIIIMKDVVKDLKRIDTYRYAEHLEKTANLHFLSEKGANNE